METIAHMKFSLKHTTYNIMACLRSLKFSYIKSLDKRQLFLIKQKYNSEVLILINLILKLHNLLHFKFKIEYLLKKYTSNQQLEKDSLISKYLQSYKNLSKKQNNFHFNFCINKSKKITLPLSLIGLKYLYVTYKILQSKHPIYIYYRIEQISRIYTH